MSDARDEERTLREERDRLTTDRAELKAEVARLAASRDTDVDLAVPAIAIICRTLVALTSGTRSWDNKR